MSKNTETPARAPEVNPEKHVKPLCRSADKMLYANEDQCPGYVKIMAISVITWLLLRRTMSQLPPLILTIVIQLAFGDLVVIGNPLFQVRIPCMVVEFGARQRFLSIFFD